jgi:hypothetical protein
VGGQGGGGGRGGEMNQALYKNMNNKKKKKKESRLYFSVFYHQTFTKHTLFVLKEKLEHGKK